MAVATGRVAYVYLEGTSLRNWGMSRRAGRKPNDALRIVRGWTASLNPDLLISEDPATANQKGARSRSVLEAVASVLDQADGLNVRLPREQIFRNKYEEAQVLARKYPELDHLLPAKPQIWQSEPRNMSYFEALSFVEQIRPRPLR